VRYPKQTHQQQQQQQHSTTYQQPEVMNLCLWNSPRQRFN